jgi:hypothetical protein
MDLIDGEERGGWGFGAEGMVLRAVLGFLVYGRGSNPCDPWDCAFFQKAEEIFQVNSLTRADHLKPHD